MDKDVSAACQMFIIPSTIMFAALANAGTEGLKTGIGLVGLATALIWLARLGSWTTDIKAADRRAALSLCWVFIVAWVVVTAVHAYFGWTTSFMRS